jgi:hypothetical protein
MKLRNLFLLGTVVAFIFALGFLLGPTTILPMFGLTAGKSEVLLTQVFGAALIGFGVLSWFARDFTDLKARDGAVISLFLFNVVAFVVTLLGVLSGAMKSGGWVAAIIFLVFAAGYGYFQFVSPGD